MEVVQGAADAAESAGGVYVRVGCRWAGVVVARLVAVAIPGHFSGPAVGIIVRNRARCALGGMDGISH